MADIAVEGLDAPFVEDYLLYLLARASHQVSRQFHRQVRAAGLNVPEWRVLASLSDADGRTVGDLAAMTLLAQPTLTKVLNRMQRDGLVRRGPDADDGRKVRIFSTAAGRAVCGRLLARARAHEAETLAAYAPAEARRLKDALKTLIRRSA